MSRYYDSNTGRFISADGMMSGVSTSLDGFNLYAYCFNNPVMMTDGEGNWPKWLKVVADIGLYVLSAATATVVASVAAAKYPPDPAIITCIITGVFLDTFSSLNNVTNAIYYNYISDGKSDITSDTYSEEGYISRWDRLDYTKQETKTKKYDKTAKMYFAEYNVHMYGWFALTSLQKIPGCKKLLSKPVGRAQYADIDVGLYDSDPMVEKFTKIFMYFGM